MENHEIGVRYCGGCNPMYDRVSVVRRLEKLLPELSFVPAQPGKPYTAVLIVNGCPTACASVADIAVPSDRQLMISGFSDLMPTRDRIRSLLVEEDVRTMDRGQVESVLPHRPPMLFVDTVTRLVPGKEISAMLTIDPQWELLKGHFPEEPVFPGVLTVEALAQAADIMVMTLDVYAGKTPLFMEISRVRFRRKILPGMTVKLCASLTAERRDAGIAVCSCQALFEDKLCAEAEITLAMR